MADAQFLALQARMIALQARLEALKWANVQDSNGCAYSPDHFFSVESELLEVAAAFAAHAIGVRENQTTDGVPERLKGDAEQKGLVAPAANTSTFVGSNPTAIHFTTEEARRGYAMRDGTKHYCCYGMYSDIGHSDDCKYAAGVNETSDEAQQARNGGQG